MRRVVSLWLPHWPVDRIRRRYGEPQRDEPLVTVETSGSRRTIAAACPAAQRLGLYAGMPVAQAQAMVPELHVWDATPEEDEAALRELARWAIGYSPVVAPDPPDGVWIDIAGCAHLFGSEEALLEHLLGRLNGQGVSAKAAVADAPGAAWAVARFRGGGIIPVGRSIEAVATLPVAALRIPPQSISVMQRLGVERFGQLAAMPRAPMVRRFGKDVALRLDQAIYEKQRRLILSSGMMAIRGRYQREGGVTHLIAEHLIDLSDLLRSVGDRDDPLSMRYGRGDEAKIGMRDRLREGPKVIVDVPPIGIPEQRAEVPAIRVATRDFR